MNIIDLLIGKKVKVMTDVGVEVPVTIKSIRRDSSTRVITPDTPENDWYGESVTTYYYVVTFETNKTKTYDSLEEIKFAD